MTAVAFAARRRRKEGQLVLAGVLMASTALIAAPKVEAAGSVTSVTNLEEVIGMSGDGSVLIGNRYNDYYRVTEGWWYRGENSGRFRFALSDERYTFATAINGAGNVVVGYGENEDRVYRAWRVRSDFTGPGDRVFEDLGTLFPASDEARSFAYGVSGDGTRVVGRSHFQGRSKAFAWIEGTDQGVPFNHAMYELGMLDGGNGTDASAAAISDDGRYAVGYSDGPASTSLAVRWDLSELPSGGEAVAQNLGSLDGMDGHSKATAVSADGSVVVGTALDSDGFDRAFRWKEGDTSGVERNVQMTDIGTLGGYYSWANAVTRDGQWVVGSSTDADEVERAFRWSEDTGIETIADWLERHDVTLGDQTLVTAASISDNGYIVGGQMYVLDGDGNTVSRSYIARVTPPEPEPGENPPPGGNPPPGSGIMDVAEYHGTLYSAAGIASAGEFLSWLPMNGAHHRPLMLTPNLTGDMCAWATGDFAHHAGSSANLALAEAGACVDLAGGSVRLGGSVGTTASWQTLALGGSMNMTGQYVLGEADWQPDGTPLLLSVTGMLGGWNARIDRAYSNGAATAFSKGETNAFGGVVRARADWLEAAVLGNTSINPYASIAFGSLHVDGYTESGGPFPATFNAQTYSHADLRLGVTAVTELSTQTKLSTTLEVAHRTGNASAASGTVDGLFNFSLGGGQYGQTWLRGGLEVDHKLSDNVALSGSVHVASNGRDPSVVLSGGLKGAF